MFSEAPGSITRCSPGDPVRFQVLGHAALANPQQASGLMYIYIYVYICFSRLISDWKNNNPELNKLSMAYIHEDVCDIYHVYIYMYIYLSCIYIYISYIFIDSPLVMTIEPCPMSISPRKGRWFSQIKPKTEACSAQHRLWREGHRGIERILAQAHAESLARQSRLLSQ